MRLLVPTLGLALPLVIPAVAEASPFAIRLSTSDLVELTTVEPPATTAAPAVDPTAAPATPPSTTESEAAPVDTPAEEPVAEEPIGDPTEEPVAEEDTDHPEDEALADELATPGKTKKGDFNAHAIGVYAGIHLVPSYFLNKATAFYANSLCRNKVGNWGYENGLTKVDGCNFYVNGGYAYRASRTFEIQANIGYLHIKAPDSLWLDNNEWDRDSCEVNDNSPGSTCNLGAADYTQIDLRMVSIEINFVGRGTLYRNQDVELLLGGGGGVGVGILVGKGIFQTPLGPNPGSASDPNSCQTPADLADFRRCTPRYYNDPDLDEDGDGNTMLDPERDAVDMGAALPSGKTTNSGDSWVSCQEHQCDGSDLDAIGRFTPEGQPWPAYPLVNIFGSFKIVIKDTFGINIDGGFKTGFFFGAGMQYYFGGGGEDSEKDKRRTKTTTPPPEQDLDAETAAGTE